MTINNAQIWHILQKNADKLIQKCDKDVQGLLLGLHQKKMYFRINLPVDEPSSFVRYLIANNIGQYDHNIKSPIESYDNFAMHWVRITELVSKDLANEITRHMDKNPDPVQIYANNQILHLIKLAKKYDITADISSGPKYIKYYINAMRKQWEV